MKVIRAEHLGMCFGVRDAIALALEEAAREPLTVLGDLVHNETVLADLRARGVRIVQQSAAVETPTVMITAHGASDKAIRRAQARGLTVLEATCPLVRVAHRAVVNLASAGYHPIIIGKRDHVEVRGLTEDLSEFDVLLTEAEVFELKERPRAARARCSSLAGATMAGAAGRRDRWAPVPEEPEKLSPTTGFSWQQKITRPLAAALPFPVQAPSRLGPGGEVNELTANARRPLPPNRVSTSRR